MNGGLNRGGFCLGHRLHGGVLVHITVFEEAQLEFDPQQAAHRLVDTVPVGRLAGSVFIPSILNPESPASHRASSFVVSSALRISCSFYRRSFTCAALSRPTCCVKVLIKAEVCRAAAGPTFSNDSRLIWLWRPS